MTAGTFAGPARIEADGRVRGHASVFGVPDTTGDVVERGAFAASLARRGAAGVRMLWQHDPAEPIGTWIDIREDAAGLHAEGRLALDTVRGREAMALIRAGAIDGLSIGFRTRLSRREPGGRGRRLLAVDLWEISIVTFPCQERARVRPVLDAPPTDIHLARLLGEAASRVGGAEGRAPARPRILKFIPDALERA